MQPGPELTAGLNSIWPAKVVRWGKMNSRSDSVARRSGCLANLIAITLLNPDIETIKIILIFKNLGLILFMYIFLSHFISAFTLYDFSRLPKMLFFHDKSIMTIRLSLMLSIGECYIPGHLHFFHMPVNSSNGCVIMICDCAIIAMQP